MTSSSKNDALEGQGTLRFAELRRRLGVSQKVLTQTLRRLERDGLVERTVHAEVPPRVEYRLTDLGATLAASVCGVWTWVEKHIEDVERARRTFEMPRKRGDR